MYGEVFRIYGMNVVSSANKYKECYS